MRILAVAGAILVGVVTASWGVELQYTFDGATPGVNSGTWAGFDGTLATKGTVGAVGVLPSVSQWGKNPGGQWLVGLGGNVLHSNTTVGTQSLTFDATPKPTVMPPADGVGFYTPESSGGNNVEQNCSVSFWFKGGTLTWNDFVGIATGQEAAGSDGSSVTHAYGSPTGGATQQTWFVPVGGNWSSDRVKPYTDAANWHFFTVSITTSWTGSDTRIYKDGVWIGQQPGNNSRDATMGILGDGLGLRVGGHNGGNDVYIDNLQWTPGTMLAPDALALFNAQFVPEPTVAMLMLAGAALFGVRRRRN